MAQRFIWDANYSRTAKYAARKQGFFHLRGANPETGRFDHGIAATHEIEKTIVVHFHQVTGITDLFTIAHFRRQEGVGPQSSVRIFRSGPVAQRNRRPPVNQFTDFTRFTKLTLIVDYENLSIRDGLAHGGWPPVELFRRQIGRPEGLGEPVHQENLCRRQNLPESSEHSLRHGTSCVRDVPQVRQLLPLYCRIWLRQQAPERGHASQAGYAFFEKQLDDFPSKDEVD